MPSKGPLTPAICPVSRKRMTNMKMRARAAADELVALATEHRSVLLIGHGFMNRYIAGCLLESGWRGPGSINQGYWSFSSYEYA